MTQDELGGSLLTEIEKLPWRKTKYLENHEYILRDQNPGLFDEICDLLAAHGYKGTFMKTVYTYVDIGDYRYWRYPILMNRADNRIPSKYFKRL